MRLKEEIFLEIEELLQYEKDIRRKISLLKLENHERFCNYYLPNFRSYNIHLAEVLKCEQNFENTCAFDLSKDSKKQSCLFCGKALDIST